MLAYLTGTVAALPRQVLPVDQRACWPAALQRKPWVDERGGAGIVVDKESLVQQQGRHEKERKKPQRYLLVRTGACGCC